jgi:hypothetical protein
VGTQAFFGRSPGEAAAVCDMAMGSPLARSTEKRHVRTLT